ncbi:MAG: hypothetical protein GXO71_05025 [Caldiserica bacterium]|nr:hypothetical protein [Caldisericota bacterium]
MGKLSFIYLDRKKLILYQEESAKGKRGIVKKEEKNIAQFPITKETWEEVVSKDDSVYLILSPSLLIFRRLSLPFGGERKIKKTIKYTLESSLPFSAEEFEVFYSKRKEAENFCLDTYIFPPLLLQTIRSLGELAVLQGIYLLPHVVYAYFSVKRNLPSNLLLWIRYKENFLYLYIRDGKAGKAGEIPWQEKDLKRYLFSRSPAEQSLPIYFWGEKEKWFNKLLSREEISIQEISTPFSDILPLIIPRCRYAPNFYSFKPASTFPWKVTLILMVLLLIFSSSRLMGEVLAGEKDKLNKKGNERDLPLPFPRFSRSRSSDAVKK